jgi:hypothetical protein
MARRPIRCELAGLPCPLRKRETTHCALFATLTNFSCKRAHCQRKEKKQLHRESPDVLERGPFLGGRTGAWQTPAWTRATACGARAKQRRGSTPALLLNAPWTAVPLQQPGRSRGRAGCHVRRMCLRVSWRSGGCDLASRRCQGSAPLGTPVHAAGRLALAPHGRSCLHPLHIVRTTL